MKKGSRHFYGSTTIGERGQVVIPAEARNVLKIKKGDKLLVFGMGHEMIALAKVSYMKKVAADLSKKVEAIKKVIDGHK
jgi:AbrB family looped-hinge helix DNA binding protein